MGWKIAGTAAGTAATPTEAVYAVLVFLGGRVVHSLMIWSSFLQ